MGFEDFVDFRAVAFGDRNWFEVGPEPEEPWRLDYRYKLAQAARHSDRYGRYVCSVDESIKPYLDEYNDQLKWRISDFVIKDDLLDLLELDQKWETSAPNPDELLSDFATTK